MTGAGPRGGLLLGVDPTVVRAEHEAVLEPGSTVLLYTDGLDLPLEAMCDALLARVLPSVVQDDVAPVAVRLQSA